MFEFIYSNQALTVYDKHSYTQQITDSNCNHYFLDQAQT